MAENAVLYALSTIAQTCAALAAFVGAVGIYRLGQLAEQQKKAEAELRVFCDRIGLWKHDVVPFSEVIGYVESSRSSANKPENLGNKAYQANVKAAEDALGRWKVFSPRSSRSRWALIGFEAWNLMLIGLSLAGFNHVPFLMCWPGMFWCLVVSAVGTVGVTGYCVCVWTSE